VTDTDTDRGRETSNALTEIRTVLSRARTAQRFLDGPTEYRLTSDGSRDHDAPRVEDPDAREMRIALAEVVELLEGWARTGPPKKPRRL
jgi:hypothetical protein